MPLEYYDTILGVSRYKRDSEYTTIIGGIRIRGLVKWYHR
jgi:hypothetical protein